MESLLSPTGQLGGLEGRATLTSTFQSLQLPGVMKGCQGEAWEPAPGTARATTSTSQEHASVVSLDAPVYNTGAPVRSAGGPVVSPSAQVVNSGTEVVNSVTKAVSSAEPVASPDAADSSLYSRSLLESLDLSLSPAVFSPLLSVAQPGDSLLVRPLAREDFSRGFLQLLGQLTTVGEVTREAWDSRFDRMAAAGGVYMVTSRGSEQTASNPVLQSKVTS